MKTPNHHGKQQQHYLWDEVHSMGTNTIVEPYLETGGTRTEVNSRPEISVKQLTTNCLESLCVVDVTTLLHMIASSAQTERHSITTVPSMDTVSLM